MFDYRLCQGVDGIGGYWLVKSFGMANKLNERELQNIKKGN